MILISNTLDINLLISYKSVHNAVLKASFSNGIKNSENILA